MSQQSTKPNSTNHLRCRYSTVDGRRCRLRVMDAQSGLCFRHVRLNQSHASAHDPEVLAAELLGSIEDFQTAEAVNLFLGNLLKQLAAQRIERRDAIALAYISQLLLNTLPALERQHEAVQKDADRRQIERRLESHERCLRRPPRHASRQSPFDPKGSRISSAPGAARPTRSGAAPAFATGKGLRQLAYLTQCTGKTPP